MHAKHLHGPDQGGQTIHSCHSGHGAHDHAAHVRMYRQRFAWALLLTLPILLLNPSIQSFLGFELQTPPWVVPAVATALFFYGGWPFLIGAYDELRQRNPGMMTLIAVAITTAWVYSAAVSMDWARGQTFFWELATLIDIMLLGHWIEMRSVMGAADALESLARLMPSQARRMRADGELETVPVAELKKGDRVVVSPGERVPADGEVVEGRSSVDQSMLTGESQPVPVAQGDEVIGGAVNQESLLVIAVTRTGEESFLAQMQAIVQEAQAHRSRTQDLANRAARWLTYATLSIGLLTLGVWTLAGAPMAFAIKRAVTVMIIACPHALGLAVPLVVAVSTTRAARQGLLVRDRNAFEQACNVDVVVFDKTGTLTQGRFAVTDIKPFGTLAERELLRIAATLEQTANHPLAQALVQAWQAPLPAIDTFRQLPGEGVEAEVNGRLYRVLSPRAVDKYVGINLEQEAAFTALVREGKTVVAITDEHKVLGLIALADQIRPEAREAVEALHAMGTAVHMLTGDHAEAANYIARQLDLDAVKAQVLPAEKAAYIEQLQRAGKRVAMVGDGVNDAPALACADVGVAIGAGTDIAIAAADIVLVKNDPLQVATLMRLSCATVRKMVQNLWWAAGYNILAVPAAAGAFLWAGISITPAVGAVLMSLSTVIVALNAQLLRRAKI